MTSIYHLLSLFDVSVEPHVINICCTSFVYHKNNICDNVMTVVTMQCQQLFLLFRINYSSIWKCVVLFLLTLLAMISYACNSSEIISGRSQTKSIDVH